MRADKVVFAARGAAPQPPEHTGGAPRAAQYTGAAMALVEHPPLRLRPSAAAFDGAIVVAERHRLGDRLSFAGDPDMQAIGEACLRFFACDDLSQTADVRLSRADALLRHWGAPQLAPSELVAASDRLHAFVTSRFGSARKLYYRQCSNVRAEGG